MRSEGDIQAEIKECRERLSNLEAELQETRLKEVPVKVGARVRTKKGREFIVASLTSWGGDVASVYGYSIKKNGEPSKRKQWCGSSRDLEIIE